MKVIVINGSPKSNGNTALGLARVMDALEADDIRTERIDIGGRAIHGCVACGGCGVNKNRKCVLDNDGVNDWMQAMFEADGVLLGSPVYYAGINGAFKAFLDRTFYVGMANGGLFRHKVGAAIVAVRRAGSTTALEQLHKYFTISEMFLPASNYWSMIFGRTPGEAEQDAEGGQCLNLLGQNMAWLMRLIQYGRDTVPAPRAVIKKRMDFIR